MGEKEYFAHETAVIDEGCKIGKGSRIWHFSHIMSGAVLGEGCNLGQNVLVSTDCVLGKNVKVQKKGKIKEKRKKEKPGPFNNPFIQALK